MSHYLFLSLFLLPLLVVALCARVMGIGTRARGAKGAAAVRLARRSSYGGGVASSGVSSARSVAALTGAREVRPGTAPRLASVSAGASNADRLRAEIAAERGLTKGTIDAHKSLYAEKDGLARAKQAEEEAQRFREEEQLREQLEEARREREEQERRLDEERAHAELRNIPGRNW